MVNLDSTDVTQREISDCHSKCGAAATRVNDRIVEVALERFFFFFILTH